jgi:hypothetical protein
MEQYTSGELVKQFNWEAARDKKGIWTGFQEYHCLREDIGAFLPAVGAAWEMFPFMTAVDVRMTGTEGGFCRMRIIFEGAAYENDGDGEAAAEYVLAVTVSGEPLPTHPRYDDLTPQDKMEAAELAANPPRSEDGKQVLEPDISAWSELKIELYNDLQSGIEAFEEIKATWTKSWVTNDMPTSFPDIGKISVPDGPLPNMGFDRDWKNGGVTTSARGKAVEIQQKWDLSGRGGWSNRYYA